MTVKVVALVLIVSAAWQTPVGLGWAAERHEVDRATPLRDLGRWARRTGRKWRRYKRRLAARRRAAEVVRQNYAIAAGAWTRWAAEYADSVDHAGGVPGPREVGRAVTALQRFGRHVPSVEHLASERATTRELRRLGLAVAAGGVLLGDLGRRYKQVADGAPVLSFGGLAEAEVREVARLVKRAATRLNELGCKTLGWTEFFTAMAEPTMAPEFAGSRILFFHLPDFEKEIGRLAAQGAFDK